MEPFDIDKIIKDKLLESNDLHAHEMNSAKPFVWSAVQNNFRKKKSLTWIHLAAAVVILMISFSFVLFEVQKGHRNSMELLSDKIEKLEQDYLFQAELLQTKNVQVSSMGSELRNVELQLAEMRQKKPRSQKENFVYRTDTVYLKQIEYITVVSDPAEPPEIVLDQLTNQPEQTGIAKVQVNEMDDAIFPSYSVKSTNQASETIKLKFGSFTTKN